MRILQVKKFIFEYLITYKIHRIYKNAKLQCKCVTHFDYLIINLFFVFIKQSLVYIEFSFNFIDFGPFSY